MRYLARAVLVVLVGVALSSVADESEAPQRILETYGYSARTPATGVERGRQVYVQWCAICHEAGPGMAGTGGLMRKYKGEVPALLRKRTDLSADFVSYVVRNGIASMPFFRKTEVSDQDLEWLADYLINAHKEDDGHAVP